MKSAIFAGIVAALASVVSAYTPPVGEPQGNPIYTPSLGSIVECGKPYSITWKPTSEGTISLVLLRGPSTNVKPIATIVEGIPNSGSYSWTPSTDLEADTTHYGIQLIQDSTGHYQYSTQFGVSNPSPSKPDTPKHDDKPTPTPDTYAPAVTPESKPTGSVVYSTYVSTVTSCDCTTAPYPAGTGVPGVYPNGTKSEYTVPPAPVYNASSTAPPTAQYTGAASQMKVGGALVAVVAGIAVALF
ncbi:hypothetical protein K440DRAFT_212052 [Wilcoxina mikolae CBS 423.85]|nr:hypothetical protein K440DRAFT_212052 [Wilcoxina mikolae CBS 423.85]